MLVFWLSILGIWLFMRVIPSLEIMSECKVFYNWWVIFLAAASFIVTSPRAATSSVAFMSLSEFSHLLLSPSCLCLSRFHFGNNTHWCWHFFWYSLIIRHLSVYEQLCYCPRIRGNFMYIVLTFWEVKET